MDAVSIHGHFNESHVLYQRWSITWEKVMETFIGNYEFKQ